MLSDFHPSFSGSYRVGDLDAAFLDRLAVRVEKGLLPAAPASRNRYRVVARSERALRFCSSGVWTGINIGLNDVLIRVGADGEIDFEGEYWTWARYCVYLALGLGVLLGVVLIPPILGVELLPVRYSVPRAQALSLGLPMIVFWALLWPWLLVRWHRKHAVACLLRILDEVSADQIELSRPCQ